jgi:hypothetical protein
MTEARKARIRRRKPDTVGVVQVQLTGPGGIDFINPADDPRKK